MQKMYHRTYRIYIKMNKNTKRNGLKENQPTKKKEKNLNNIKKSEIRRNEDKVRK